MKELELDRVIHLAHSYQEPRVLLTASELGLFSILRERSMTAEGIAQSRGWDPQALQVLLDALAVMGFLEKTLNRYSIAQVNRDLLSPDDDRGVIAMVRHAATAWPSWSGLTARIAANGALPNIDASQEFVASMHAIAEKLAPGIAALIRPEMGRSFLDVGGGSGAYTIAFLARNRSLRASLLDRPEILEHTQGYLAQADCSDCVQLVKGDATCDEWPGDQDLVFLSALIHSQSPAGCDNIYRRAFRSLAPGGRVVVRDHVMSENRLRPRAGTLFNVHMLVCTADGRTYTFSEIRRGMDAAGFVDVRLVQDGERMNGLVEAFKPTGVE